MLETSKNHSVCRNLISVVDTGNVDKIQTVSVFHDNAFNVMVLTIPTGHTLKEHVSPRTITLHVLSGSGHVSVDGEAYPVSKDSWFYIQPDVPHELVSDETLIVLLSLFTGSSTESEKS